MVRLHKSNEEHSRKTQQHTSDFLQFYISEIVQIRIKTLQNWVDQCDVVFHCVIVVEIVLFHYVVLELKLLLVCVLFRMLLYDSRLRATINVTYRRLRREERDTLKQRASYY